MKGLKNRQVSISDERSPGIQKFRSRWYRKLSLWSWSEAEPERFSWGSDEARILGSFTRATSRSKYSNLVKLFVNSPYVFTNINGINFLQNFFKEVYCTLLLNIKKDKHNVKTCFKIAFLYLLLFKVLGVSFIGTVQRKSFKINMY